MAKFWCVLTTITLLASLLVTSVQGRHVVCLSGSSVLSTSCNESCTANFEDMSAYDIIEGFDVFICSSAVDLRKVITFENKMHVSFAAEQSATITCLNESAGIVFRNVNTVSISGVHLVGCSVRQNGSVSFTASIVISHCNSVTVSDFEVRNSTGVGLALINIGKSVEVTESLFASCENGGLYIDYFELHKDRNCNTTIHISTSTFTDNKVWNIGNKLSNGGGLKVFFQDLNHSVFIVIVECVFEKNEANSSTADVMDSFSGGAVYLNFIGTNSGSEVFVHINNSRFCNNSAKLHGGAVAVSYHGQQHYKNKTEIVFSDCKLLRNRASDGGGISLELTQERSEELSVTFVSCEWTENMAEYGAAVIVVPSYQGDQVCGCFSGPVFENCAFKENIARKSEESQNYQSYNVTHRIHRGILYSRDIDIQLRERILFERNNGSAMCLLSSNVYFNENSNIRFIKNKGYRGGAIAMHGTSVLHVYNNVSILFKENNAFYLGGAIYSQKIYGHSYGSNSHESCFLQYNDSNQDRNINISFQNNTSPSGYSIFLSTLSYCHPNTVATFNFTGSDKEREISTMGQSFITSDNSTLKFIIPGQVTSIGFSITDDTNVSVPSLLKISVIQPSDISVDDAYVYTSNDKIKLKGKPNSSGELKVSILHLEGSFLTMNFTLQECPPGFVYSENESVCTCSVYSGKKYAGISKCDMSTFQASLIHGFWAGYTTENGEGFGSREHFHTAICPKGYCKRPEKHILEIILPNDTNSTKISIKVCRENRRDIMCGNCVEGHSVLYHSYNYICSPDRRCTVGWLFYILSELVPVTIFFAVVLCFDINFTSGFVSAFVFYAQMFDTLLVGANNLIFFEEPIHNLLNVLKFIVRIFNLSFFAVEQLSFCLWKGANTLDIIAFNYVTIIYSFILVIITVALANRCSIKVNQILGVDKSHLSNSIIHGLSSFLVLCYSQSTRVSLLLLIPTFRIKENGIKVFYYAEFHYFRGRHLLYAIPAVLFLIFITLLPPLLLLCYPLCYKVLALCKLEESKFTKVLCKVIPLEKYKPFFDSFQGTFKDEHYYFAGLLFLYRLTTLLAFAVSDSLLKFYTLIELQFILILLLHALISPHKSNSSNKLHMSVFALLALLNSLTIFSYVSHAIAIDDSVLVSVATSVQVLLACIPVVCMFTYLGVVIVIWIRKKLKSQASSVGEVTDAMTLFLLEDSGRNSTLSSNYSRDN